MLCRKRSLHRLLAEAGAILCLSAATAMAGDPSAARQAELRNLVVQDCGSCHGMTLKGGLGSPLRPGDLEYLETPALALIVLDGIPGTPMPPWRGLLTVGDAHWIARALKNGEIE